MGRPSKRAQRRGQIVGAFGRVLARHGVAGATIAAVAAEANVAPGLLHHHFEGRADLLETLLETLTSDFSRRIREAEGDSLTQYVDAALSLGARADVTAARCWVGLFAEALREPGLNRRLRRFLDGQLATIQDRSGGALDEGDAGALLAYIVGALVLGSFAPKRVRGFAAARGHRFAQVLADGGG